MLQWCPLARDDTRWKASHFGLSLLQICTTWQGTMTIVQAFPYFPDLVAMVNALAEKAGEPSVEQIKAAADAWAGMLQGCWVCALA